MKNEHKLDINNTAKKTYSIIENIDKFVEEFDNMKKKDKMDLSSDQDLTIAVMNLISIEEHFFFTGAKTGKNNYYDMINQIREMRKELLKKLITEYEGEIWCISKHLLAASYRLMEVGTKKLATNEKEEAYNFFGKAYELYCLFWGLNLKLIDSTGIKKIDESYINQNDHEKISIKEKLKNLIKKVVDCCIE